MTRNLLCAAAFAGLAGLAAAPGVASAAGAGDCFYVHNWQNWTAPAPNVIYLRTDGNDVYRLDLSGGGSSELQEGFAHLVTKFGGEPDLVCSPVDLQLSVADNDGFHEPLLVDKITKVTPAEVNALPKRYRP